MHLKYKEMIYLKSIGELSLDKEEDLQNHFAECEECRNEFNSLIEMKSVINALKPNLNEEKFDNLRRDTFKIIENLEKYNSQSFFEKFGNSFLKHAIAYSLTILVGIFIGKSFFNSAEVIYPENANIIIDNVSFEGANSGNEVNVDFRITSRKKFKGRIDEPETKFLLSKALVKAKNPWVRIQTANKIFEETKGRKSIDIEIENALLKAAIKDENPAVRLKAVQAIKNLEMTEKVKKVMIYILENETNSAVKIEAISILGNKNEILNNDDKLFLSNFAQKEKSNFVKRKVEYILK